MRDEPKRLPCSMSTSVSAVWPVCRAKQEDGRAMQGSKHRKRACVQECRDLPSQPSLDMCEGRCCSEALRLTDITAVTIKHAGIADPPTTQPGFPDLAGTCQHKPNLSTLADTHCIALPCLLTPQLVDQAQPLLQQGLFTQDVRAHN
eukprot:scaffold209457_cov19-Tisochrysis_lutea.AAC.1